MENFVLFLSALLILIILLGAISGAKTFGGIIRRGFYLLVLIFSVFLVSFTLASENPEDLLELLSSFFKNKA